jgi:thiosulfate/3-mercaptopyruvate sulfurtransferase
MAPQASLVTFAVLAALGLGMLSETGLAQDAKTSHQLLVEVEWLEQHYQDPNTVIIHFGPEEDYAKEHIPGAVWLSFDHISAPHEHDDEQSLMLEIPDHGKLQDLFRQSGINNDSRVIVYWSSDWVTPSSRMMLTLDYAGLGRQSMLLNGGLEAWTAADLPVTEVVSHPKTGNFTMHPRDDLIVSAEWVQQHAGTPGYSLVDARSAAHYDGVRDSEAGAGHIPGAVNIDWRSLVDGEPARWHDSKALAATFEEAGVKPGDTVVGYCHIGQYATAMLFAARTLGYDVKLYDGSMQEWGGIKQLPLEKPKTAGSGEGHSEGR